MAEIPCDYISDVIEAGISGSKSDVSEEDGDAVWPTPKREVVVQEEKGCPVVVVALLGKA